MSTRTISAPAQAFGFVETLHKPTEEQVEAVIESMKDHADRLLDWWEDRDEYNSPEGELVELSIIQNNLPNGDVTVGMKYYFKSDRFYYVREVIKYQAEHAPQWNYDPI